MIDRLLVVLYLLLLRVYASRTECPQQMYVSQDIATVDILERAEGVDPSGERTIGVLTKSDLISPGGEDEILEVVNNRRKPLALGYTMLKNRSQKDIKDGVSAAKARYFSPFQYFIPKVMQKFKFVKSSTFVQHFCLYLLFC